MSRRIVFSGLVAGIILFMAAPAWAHVTVSPNEAAKGGFTTLTFQVPNEKDDANTTKVEVSFPQDAPIADAAVEAVAGWTIDVTKTKLETPVTTDEGESLDEAVNTITWTAEAGKGIAPGYFEQFKVSVGLPDDTDALEFPTLQTYSNGDIVKWIDPVTEDGPEAEFPEPVVTLTAGGDDDHHATSTTVAASSGDAASGTTTAQDDVDTAKTIGIVAIIFSVIALFAVAFSMFRKRPTST
jgi:uncharacterized protein YcnI